MPFAAISADPGAFCTAAGRPPASTAPAGVASGRERTLAGSRPFAQLIVTEGQQPRLLDLEGKLEKVLSGLGPLAALDEALSRFSSSAPAADAPAGCVIALAYDAAPHFLGVKFRTRGDDPFGRPLLVASFYEAVLVRDSPDEPVRALPTGLTHPDWESAEARVRLRCRQLEERLASSRPAEVREAPAPLSPPVGSSLTDGDYRSAIAAAQRYIAAGDIYQVNLSQRLEIPLPAGVTLPALWERLIATHPTGWSAYFDMGPAGVLLSNSPECFLRRRGEIIETFPIKGTRPNVRNPERMRAELAGNTKELAEHRMIVDLERNDLGRIAQVGSVRVTAREYVETYPTLHHLVSCVRARLSPKTPLTDVLAATFPGGSITGAPKRRAVEIIDELEPVRRGFYCGTLGTLARDGTADFNILIRSAWFNGVALTYSTGGGIVADSDPEAEVAESWLKARAFLQACGIDMPQGESE